MSCDASYSREKEETVILSGKKKRHRRRRSNCKGLSEKKRKLQKLPQFLIPKALKLMNVLTKTNMLHRACERGNEEETRNLIKDLNSSQLLIRDASGETAVHIAINHGHVGCALLLLNSPALEVSNELSKELYLSCGEDKLAALRNHEKLELEGSGANNIEQSGILLTEDEMNTEMNTGINTKMNTKINTEIKTEIGEDIKVEQEDSLENSHGFICTKCSAHFLNENYFLEHIKEHHSVDHNIQTAEKPRKKFRCRRIQTFSCNECSHTFNRLYQLRDHILANHEKQFKCSECGKKYVHKGNFAKHQRQKHPEMNADSASERCDHLKNRQITLKDDASSEKKNMLGHLEQTNEKPFSCNECSYTANTAYQLKEHAHKHRKEKPFSCKECSYTANEAHHFKEHAYKHMKEKPLNCNECYVYAATRANNLRDHILANHRNMQPFKYKCTICGNKYVRKRDCARHLRNTHQKMNAFPAIKRQVTLNPGQTYQHYTFFCGYSDSPTEERGRRTKQSEEKPSTGNQHFVRDPYVLRNDS